MTLFVLEEVLHVVILLSFPISLHHYIVHFPLVCYWCGLPEESLVRDDEYMELERNFQTVHVICMLCKHDGKHPFTGHPLNTPKRKKKS